MSTGLSAGLYGAGMGIKALGIHNEISAQNQANEYNAQVASNNALISSTNANLYRQKGKQARESGRVEEEKFRQRGERLRGQNIAQFGASGVDVNSGSPVDVDMDTAELIELDALTIRHNTDIEQFDYEMQGWNADRQADDYSFKSKQLKSRKRSSFLPVAGSLLTGLSGLDGRYFGLKSKKKDSSVGTAGKTYRRVK